MAIVKFLRTIEKLQKYILHKINSVKVNKYIYVLEMNPAKNDVFWFIS